MVRGLHGADPERHPVSGGLGRKLGQALRLFRSGLIRMFVVIIWPHGIIENTVFVTGLGGLQAMTHSVGSE